MTSIHPDDGLIQRFADDELTDASFAGARAHIGGCAECRARIETAREENAWLIDRLRTLDHPAPRVTAAAILHRGTRRTSGWERWAAGILIAVGVAGVAYAAPGSPLPALIERLTTRMRGTPPQVVPAPAPVNVTGGTAVAPGARLRIVFLAEQPGGIAIVSLTDAGNVAVRAVNGEAAFTVDPERISIANAGSTARFEIDVPSTAPHVEILIGDRRVLAKEANRVVTDAPRDPDGRYRVPLSLARR